MRYYTCDRKTKFNAGADEEYVFAIGLTASGSLVASGSDRSLRVFDAVSLAPIAAFPNVHTKISDLKVQGNEAYTCGEDGLIKLLDTRSGTFATLVKGSQHPPWLCLDVNASTIAAGGELKGSDATVSLWDMRRLGQKVFTECHTEDVTQISLQSNPLRVLSGGQDGLMVLLDPSLGEEDDCVVQVFNHNSSLAHCGFLNEKYVYGISHMETMSVYNVDPDEEANTVFDLGDLRSSLGCDYVAGFIPSSTGHALITGSFSEPVACVSYFDVSTMQFDRTGIVQLVGAHQSELIRCGVLQDENQLIITGGENNEIRAWKHDETIQGSKGSNSARIRRKSKGLEEAARFQPY